MARDTRVKGYVSAVGNNVVPGIYLDDSAGAIVGAAGRNLGSAISSFGGAVQNFGEEQRRFQAADLEADWSNFTYETEQGLVDLDRSQPANQSNRYDAAEQYITERANTFQQRIAQTKDPRLEAVYAPRIADFNNNLRGKFRANDFGRKRDYFVQRTTEMLNQNSKRLAGNPQYLDEAENVLENFILAVPNEHLSLEEKTEMLYKGKQKLKGVAYVTEVEQELERGESWANENAGGVLDKIRTAESGGRSDAKNPNSSALGPYQFISSTFMQFMRERHPELVSRHGDDVLKLRTDQQLSREGAQWYLGKIGKTLQRNGLPVNDATLYLGYFLGEGGATRMLRAPSDDLAINHATPDQVAANKSVFYKDGRPRSVAEMKQWSADKMGQTTVGDGLSSDPRYADLDYDTQLQLRSQAESNVRSRAAEEDARQKADKANVMNSALMEISTGKAGRGMIDQLAESGQFDYDDIKKMNTALKDYEDGVDDYMKGAAMMESGALFDPDNSDHKKAMNAVGEQFLGGKNYEMINQKDPRANAVIQTLIQQSGGAAAPGTAIGLLKGNMRSNDWSKAKYANDILSDLVENYPDVMRKHLSAEEVEDLRSYDRKKDTLTEEELKINLGIGAPAEVQKHRKATKEMAGEYFQKEFDKEWPQITEDLFDGWLSREPENMRTNSRAMYSLKIEYMDAFETYMIKTGGDQVAARELADKSIQESWGVNYATKSGRGQIMKHPPSRTYPNLSNEVIDKDIRTTYSIPTDSTYELMSDDQTEKEVKAGKPPSYYVVINDEQGAVVAVKGANIGDYANRIQFQDLEEARKALDVQGNLDEYGGQRQLRKDDLGTLYGRDYENRNRENLEDPYIDIYDMKGRIDDKRLQDDMKRNYEKTPAPNSRRNATNLNPLPGEIRQAPNEYPSWLRKPRKDK
jgi:hypothetical protein